MRVKGTTVQQIVLGLALLVALVWNLAQAAETSSEVKGLQVASSTAGTRVDVRLSRSVAYRTLSLSGPERFVLDLPGAALARGVSMPAGAGAIRGVRSGQPAPGTTRLVFDLSAAAPAPKPRVETAADGSLLLVLEWAGTGTATSSVVPATGAPVPTPASVAGVSAAGPAAVPASSPTSSALPTAGPPAAAPAAADPAAILNGTASTQVPPAVPSPAPAAVAVETKPAVAPAPEGPKALRTTGTRPLIVAIDAGHGGQDPGAIGPSGKREKDATLAIARELARQVNATPGLKAYLTRDSDMFLPLTRRTQLARQAKADIFISIHADAAENRNARGSSVYVLSLRGASSQRARWLADKENAADLIGGTRMVKSDDTLASVLLDLTQSGQMRASEDAAGHVLHGLKQVGYNHKPHLERANFAVLRTSDMPAMLVETAFISNAEEEKRLNDPQYQRTLARAVLDGIDTYFSRQPPPGTLYASRALEGSERDKAAQEQARLVATASTPAGGASATTAKAGGSPE